MKSYTYLKQKCSQTWMPDHLLQFMSFWRKKIEIWHELGYGNHVGRMFFTTRPSATGKGAMEYWQERDILVHLKERACFWKVLWSNVFIFFPKAWHWAWKWIAGWEYDSNCKHISEVKRFCNVTYEVDIFNVAPFFTIPWKLMTGTCS